ncbi:P-loop containing nucleoside triphosphate hydrolase protein [Amanita rubescens]|nr:P-loop containing nucleoside triphosphate hydrolase protein [Amanita rubescens]
MDVLKSLIQPLVGGAGTSSVVDGMKLVMLGGTVETARRVSSSAWSHFINSFFLTAHFSEEDYPYDWLMLWLSRCPEWQRSREFETTTRTSSFGLSNDNSFGDDDEYDDDDAPGKVKTRVVFQPTFDSTHTIYYRGHWLRVRRTHKSDGVVARSNTILKQLVLQAKKEYEAEAVHRIQIYFADSHGSWRWTDSRHKRPMSSIVLNPGVKEMLLNDAKDFIKSEKWYADRGIPFRRGYLLHGVPGSGKSSLIHAIAGELMLDIYVVSLSASWISDSTLTTLMGRVPARCILLLEDLDAAFTRSTSRENSSTRRKKNGDQLSDVNTLSLSGLLNALDGVAAAEGRILFATTNHLERLDPALSRPGRMDVWVEFRNASRWQAEALFRNFFPSTEEEKDEPLNEEQIEREMAELRKMELKKTTEFPPKSTSTSSQSLMSLFLPKSMSSQPDLTSFKPDDVATARVRTVSTPDGKPKDKQFGDSNQSYLPPPVEEHILASQHSAKPLDAATLNKLAKKFADGVPEEEFSVAALQGYLLRNKSQPEASADGVVEWVKSEREMKERLMREKEAKEAKEKLDREKRKKQAAEKKELQKKEQELEKLRQQLAEKDKCEKDEKPANEDATASAAEGDEEEDNEEDGDEQNEHDESLTPSYPRIRVPTFILKSLILA